ncbi:hypothetical protein TNCV_1274681 [Trichonephila clavipes]|nr:hypothetical protein TNCV_1274681 [Trichonephila clavipes]
MYDDPAKKLTYVCDPAEKWLSTPALYEKRTTDTPLLAKTKLGPSSYVSEHTVQRTLLHMELRNRCLNRVPLLLSVIFNYAYSSPGSVKNGPLLNKKEFLG